MEDLLKNFTVVVEIPVAWGEMDAFNHVNNIVYFRYFESARIVYFEKSGILEFMNEHGIGPILASTRCNFKTPLTYPDTVSVGARVQAIEDDRFVIEHRVVSHHHQRIAAEGEAVIVSYNYRDNKKVSIPDELKQRIMHMDDPVVGI